MTQHYAKVAWRDAFDVDKHLYQANDPFPHEDSVVLEFKPERIEFLKEKGWIGEVEEPKDKTVAELQAELDAAGIDYDKKAKKADLIALLEK